MTDVADHLTAGRNDLPKVTLVARDGARAEAYLHGAHVTSWVPAGGTERLFLSERSAFAPGAAIRGGVPIIFPQFASIGPLPKHGFARNTEWTLVPATANADVATARFRLSSSTATRAIWPRSFVAELGVSVARNWLELELTVKNTDAEQASFTAALHTYLRVADVRKTRVRGLTGRTFRQAKVEGVDQAEQLEIAGELDRVYFDVANPLEVVDHGGMMRVSMTGFTDVVVWNPGPTAGAALADLEPDGYLRMLCVEAAVVKEPVVLAPGDTWSGAQRLTWSGAG